MRQPVFEKLPPQLRWKTSATGSGGTESEPGLGAPAGDVVLESRNGRIPDLMNIGLLVLLGLTFVVLGIISFEKWVSETSKTNKPRLSAQEIRLLMQIVVSIFVLIAALYIILSGSL